MHICYICEYPLPEKAAGGIATFVRDIASSMAVRGHRVTVIATNGNTSRSWQEDNLTIHTYNSNNWQKLNFLSNALAIRKLIKRANATQKIDIIETPELGLAFLKKRKGTRFIIRLNGGHHFFTSTLGLPLVKTKAALEKMSFSKADGLIGVSKFVLNETKKLVPFPEAPVTIIHNPIDTTKFLPRPEASVVRGQIMFAGSLVEKKGIRQLLQAMPLVLAAHPHAKLLVYGRDTLTGPGGKSYRTFLEEGIPDEIRPHILFKGPIPNDEIPEALSKAELCVYPSHMEAMPLAWLEALAMAKPFIGGKPGPGPEVIQDGENGLLCDPFKPEDIARCIVYMLSHSKHASEMGIKGRQKILDSFLLDTICEQSLHFYMQVSKVSA